MPNRSVGGLPAPLGRTASSIRRRGWSIYIARRPWLLLVGVAVYFVAQPLFSGPRARLARISAPQETPLPDPRLEDALREARELRRANERMSAELEAAREAAAEAKARSVRIADERAAGRRKWLVIAMPSVPRAKDINYLTPTLDSLLDQLPGDESHPFFDSVRIVVCNMRPGKHRAFDKARRLFALNSRARAKGHYVRFIEKHGDGGYGMPISDPPPEAEPAAKVQRQTADLVYMLHASLWAANDAIEVFERGEGARREHGPTPAPALFMFMEDDFPLCQNGWEALVHFIQRASAYHDWAALRVSYGLNGLLVRGADVEAIADYFQDGYRRRPPDHLASEWYLAETDAARRVVGRRRNMAFRYNLHRHIGVQSAIDSPDGRYNPPCFSPLADWLFDSELFHVDQCPNDDVWPCSWELGPPPPDPPPEPGAAPRALLPGTPPEEVTGGRLGREWPPPLINWVGGVCSPRFEEPPVVRPEPEAG